MNRFLKRLYDFVGVVPKTEIQELGLKSVSSDNRPVLRNQGSIGLPIAPNRSVSNQLGSYKGWVYACVRAIAEETANIKLTLYKRTKQNDFEVVESHPVLDLIYKVNPIYTSYLLWEATAAYTELTGEAFWWLVGPAKNPKEIWLLRPDWVRIRDSKNSLIEAYEYGPNAGQLIVIPQEEIVHFKDFNPLDAYRGYGTTKAAATSIDTDNFAADYNKNFFYNSAIPGGALETDQSLTNRQYEQIRQDWNDTHQGKDRAWKIAILEAGLKWHDFSQNRRDMDFLEGRKYDRDEILSIFRVPKPIIAVQDDVNRAAAREARAVFLENNITHKMRRLTSFLNEFLLPRYGDSSLFFDFEDPVPNDEGVKLNYYRTGLGGAPFLTVNEVREMENRDPVDGGDVLMQPFSFSPIGSTPPDATKNFRKRLQNIFNIKVSPYPHDLYKLDQLAEKITPIVEKMLRNLKGQNEAKTVIKAIEAELVEDDPRDVRWRKLVARTDPAELRMIRLLKDLFIEQEAEVKRRLETDDFKRIMEKKSNKDLKQRSIFDITDLTGSNGVFADVLMQFLSSVIESEGIITIKGLVAGAVFFMQSKEVKNYIKKEGAKYIFAINEETTNQLREALSEGVGKGESIAQLAKRVEGVYVDATGYRAERIARSEVLRASNFGTLEAYRQSGVVEAKEWLTAKDERVCPWCGPKDGTVKSLSDPFAEKGETLVGKNESGKTVKFNVGIGDIDMPPLHPNCRCTLIPVLADDNQ